MTIPKSDCDALHSKWINTCGCGSGWFSSNIFKLFQNLLFHPKGMAKINAKNDGVFPFEPRPRHKKGEALVRVSQVSLKLWGRPLMEIMETIRRENEDNMPSPSWVDDLGSDYLKFLWLWQSRNNGSALARLGVWNCGNKLEVRDTIWKRNGQGFLWNYLRPSPRYLSQKRKLLFAVIRTLMKILAIFTPNQPPSE